MLGDCSRLSLDRDDEGVEQRGAEGAEDRDTEGVEGEGNEEGCPPPQSTRGSGERRKLSQRGPGRSPGQKRILVYFEVERTHLVTTNLLFLTLYVTQKLP